MGTREAWMATKATFYGEARSASGRPESRPSQSRLCNSSSRVEHRISCVVFNVPCFARASLCQRAAAPLKGGLHVWHIGAAGTMNRGGKWLRNMGRVES